uniref:Cysteine proteinase n=1 Tax=Entamoeba histolytica TaxID=5759 RepID=Q27645_ENTHI|nr:cysteine proteinase [Entamoeba histolytica]
MFGLLFVTLISLSKSISFDKWMAKNNQKFKGIELLRRRAIFNMNSMFVAKFNQQHNFQLSVDGPYAAMTNAEYNTLLKARTVKNVNAPVRKAIKGDIPTAIDWRAEGKLTPIRDHTQCGSCYSFGSLAAIESRLLIGGSQTYNADNLDLSEQQIVDCSNKNNGCNGGSILYVFAYTKRNGVIEEKDYPYTATNGTCQYDADKIIVKNAGQVIVEQRNEVALVEAIAEGPVAVAIDAGQASFQLYKSGVYDEPKCKKVILNHAVCAVGYGSQDGQDYYIVRNSWGTSWGMDGYILMSRNKNNQCGIANDAIYPTGVTEVKK